MHTVKTDSVVKLILFTEMQLSRPLLLVIVDATSCPLVPEV